MKKFEGTPGKWFTYHNLYANPAGWVIKAQDNIKTPIGIIHEPQGGQKNEVGQSPRQKANAQLIAKAPELLEALQFAIKFIRMCPKLSEGDRPKGLEKWETIIEEALKS